MLLFISYHHGIKTDIAKANKNNKNKAPCFSPSPSFRKNLPQISNKFFSWGISPHPHVQRDSGGAAFAHLSFQLRYKPKVSSVVQGQMSKEKLRSFGTSCVKPSSFLSFFFFFKFLFWFQYPKRDNTCWKYLLCSEVKRQNILGCIWSRLEGICWSEDNTGLNAIKPGAVHRFFFSTYDCTSLLSNASLPQHIVALKALSAWTWINFHKFFCGAVQKYSCSLFTQGEITEN